MESQTAEKPLYRLYGMPIPQPGALDVDAILRIFPPPGRGRGIRPRGRPTANGTSHSRPQLGLNLEFDRVDEYQSSVMRPTRNEGLQQGSHAATSRMPSHNLHRNNSPATESRGRLPNRGNPALKSSETGNLPLSRSPSRGAADRHDFDPGECDDSD